MIVLIQKKKNLESALQEGIDILSSRNLIESWKFIVRLGVALLEVRDTIMLQIT